MAGIFGVAGTAASAAPSAPSPTVAAAQAAVDLPVTGTMPDGSPFTGQLSQLTQSVVNGVPVLQGVLMGTGLPVGGARFTTAISGANATCGVLTLNLSPLNLPPLGSVNLAPVNLVTDSVAGLGSLLGLCGLALNPRATLALPFVALLLGRVIPALGLGPVLSVD
jgi:hypothetical protein